MPDIYTLWLSNIGSANLPVCGTGDIVLRQPLTRERMLAILGNTPCTEIAIFVRSCLLGKIHPFLSASPPNNQACGFVCL